MHTIELAKAISELGILIVIAAVSIGGGSMMFRSLIKNNDKLAPILTNIADVNRDLAHDVAAHKLATEQLQKEAKEVAEEVAKLRETIRTHEVICERSRDATFNNSDLILKKIEDLTGKVNNLIEKEAKRHEKER